MSTVDTLEIAGGLDLDYQLWASGGIRNGLDAAKSMALGATKVSYAKQMLAPAMESTEAVVEKMLQIEKELKIALFCTGSKNIASIQDRPHLLKRDFNV